VADIEGAARAIEDFLRALGHPPESDPELRETGDRVARAFADELLAGYAMDPAAILAERTAAKTEGMVILANVRATTICPHHLLPASGTVHVGYLPGDAVVGLGALGRLVDCQARRLILQEELAQSIADALVAHLGARGAGCVVEMSQACVSARGERRHDARAVTHAFAGTMAADPALRAELLGAIPRPAAAVTEAP
jgi:GTP cyclohydrolase IA